MDGSHEVFRAAGAANAQADLASDESEWETNERHSDDAAARQSFREDDSSWMDEGSGRIEASVSEEGQDGEDNRPVSKEGRWLPTELLRFVEHLDGSLHAGGRSQRQARLPSGDEGAVSAPDRRTPTSWSATLHVRGLSTYSVGTPERQLSPITHGSQLLPGLPQHCHSVHRARDDSAQFVGGLFACFTLWCRPVIFSIWCYRLGEGEQPA